MAREHSAFGPIRPVRLITRSPTPDTNNLTEEEDEEENLLKNQKPLRIAAKGLCKPTL